MCLREDISTRKHGIKDVDLQFKLDMANITSAAQLVQALDRGQRDVFLSSHIDLRTLQLERSQDDILVLGNQTKSLRVRFYSLCASHSPATGHIHAQAALLPCSVHCDRWHKQTNAVPPQFVPCSGI